VRKLDTGLERIGKKPKSTVPVFEKAEGRAKNQMSHWAWGKKKGQPSLDTKEEGEENSNGAVRTVKRRT